MILEQSASRIAICLFETISEHISPQNFLYLPSSYSHLSPRSFSLEIVRHVFPFAYLPDGIRLPVQWRIDEHTTSNFSPTRRNHRLPKSDGRFQWVLLGFGSSKRWHENLAQHMEPDNHHLPSGRTVGKLLHAFGRLAKQCLETNTLRSDRI